MNIGAAQILTFLLDGEPATAGTRPTARKGGGPCGRGRARQPDLLTRESAYAVISEREDFMTTIKTILTTTAGAAILALGSLLWGCSTDVDEQLNGTWVGEEIGYDSGVWTFELGDGNADVHAFMDGVELEVYVGTYSTRSGAGLPRVDFHIDSSDVPSYAGETAHCVYDVLGDELSLACYEPGESGYPDSLEPGGGARAFVLSLVYEGGDDDDDVVGDDDDVVGDDDDAVGDDDDAVGDDDDATDDADGDGYSVADGDCDDSDPTVYPGAPEECDGLDNDCNGVADDGC